MYQKILVPLDGSELAECSLAHVKAIASGCGVSEVVLFQAVEPLAFDSVGALAITGGDVIQAESENQRRAREYLTKVSRGLKRIHIASEIVVTDGPAADEILDYAHNNNVDLIIMSTHGRSGPSRWYFGSVADRVVRHSRVPVLSVAAPGCRVKPD